MKKIIFIFLLSLNLCSIDELKKLSSVVVYEEEGVIYLNTKDYSLGDKIYIKYSCAGGNINQKIYYEFSGEIPTDPDYCPYRSLKPSANAQSSQTMYYYYIKKNENFQYLIMRYIDFEGNKLIVEHNSMSLGGFVFMIIGIVFGSIVALAIIIVSIILIRRIINDYRDQRYIEATQKEKETEIEKEKDKEKETETETEKETEKETGKEPINSDIYYEPAPP